MAELHRTMVTGWCERCQAEWTGSHTCRAGEASDSTLPVKAQAATIALLRTQLAQAEAERDRAVEALREIATGEEVTKGAVTFVHPGRDYAKQVLAQLDHSEDTGACPTCHQRENDACSNAWHLYDHDKTTLEPWEQEHARSLASEQDEGGSDSGEPGDR